MSKQSGKTGEQKKVVSSIELFTLTYGALVAQLMKDLENEEAVNKKLDEMGYNIGVRLVEDFLARTNVGRCQDLRETAEVIAKQGFKMFLGIVPTISNFSPQGNEFSLILDSNPLTEFVELPQECTQLHYSQVLCGAIRGALEMVQLETQVTFLRDATRGDNSTEIRVKFVRYMDEVRPPGDD